MYAWLTKHLRTCTCTPVCMDFLSYVGSSAAQTLVAS